MREPTASIVIATRNRGDLLSDCLAGIANQDFAGRVEEVIVVDNSDDSAATEKAVANAECRWPVRLLISSPPGVSRARNKGLSEANGEITIFLDDDEIPCEDWLSELLSTFSVSDEDRSVDIVAGNYEPVWAAHCPEWLDEKFFGVYSVGFQRGSEPRRMREREWVLEGNVAIRTSLLIAAGGFDEALGRAGASLVSGEGIIFAKLQAEGAVAWYNPRAVVRHIIHADRLNRNWLMRRMFASGVSSGISSAYFGEGVPIPAGAAINLKNFAELDFEALEGEELLIASQICHILGFISQQKGLL